MRRASLAAISLGVLLGGCTWSFCAEPLAGHQPVRAYRLDYPRRVRYGHHLRDGPDAGRLSLARRRNLACFASDGVRFVRWQPPAGQQLPESSYALLVTRDGTLWIGTFAGLASWNNGKLTQYPEVGARFITSLLEDREGTVWVGTLDSPGAQGRLCAIRSGNAQCYGEDGAFGSFVWSLGEDSSGALWAGAESGLWRLEARSAEALCGARSAACRPDSIRRRPANRWDQRWRTQAGRW